MSFSSSFVKFDEIHVLCVVCLYESLDFNCVVNTLFSQFSPKNGVCGIVTQNVVYEENYNSATNNKKFLNIFY